MRLWKRIGECDDGKEGLLNNRVWREMEGDEAKLKPLLNWSYATLGVSH